MSKTKQYILSLLHSKGISIPDNKSEFFENFVNNENHILLVSQIIENQNMITKNWTITTRIQDVLQQAVYIPNGTVGKIYEAPIDLEKLNWKDFSIYTFEGLSDLGLVYDETNSTIKGTPSKSGDLQFVLKYKINGEDNQSPLHEKPITLIINPDPKSLWKDIASDADKDDAWRTANCWKPDNTSDFSSLGDRHIVVSSKRGRSHANVGSFRDDHYAYKHFDATGWSVVAVSDGAGSAKLSREGSRIACEGIIDYFSHNLNEDMISEFDLLLTEYQQGGSEDHSKKLNHFVYNKLGKAALYVHKQLEEFATKKEISIKDLHATLIFTLIKKYEFGYAVLSFGVGDCPIGLLSKDLSQVTLMNWLDVGEFGGGTRFITMPEIFQSEKFSTRFGFKLIDDFSYLMLMTDGIYDPKFVVEANLDKIESWQAFVADIQGTNDDHCAVQIDSANQEIASQLSSWMDFWSPGNHDDRTLAIIF